MYSLQQIAVYKFIASTSDSLQQIVGTRYLQFTDQSVSYYTHFCTVDMQSVFQPISELLHFLRCLHVQEKHYLAFISLLLMELKYGL